MKVQDGPSFAIGCTSEKGVSGTPRCAATGGPGVSGKDGINSLTLLLISLHEFKGKASDAIQFKFMEKNRMGYSVKSFT